MKRLLIIAVVLIAAAFAFITLRDTPDQIAILDAKAIATPGNASMFMVGLTIENAGVPDTLLDVSSPTDAQLSIMNPGMMGKPVVIPGKGTGILAMDGAHLMLMGADLEPGGFLPITLNFENAGEVATRVQIAEMAPMMHDMSGGVTETPAPSLQIVPVGALDADGFELNLDAQNFTFKQAADDAMHVAGEGHAHVYLNGLKLGRVYEGTYQIGALDAGDYILTVSLNTHDHRPYLDGDAPVSQTLSFTIP